MLGRFLQFIFDLLARKPKREVKIRFSERETTKHYKDFKKYLALEYPSLDETEEIRLCRYACQTGKSPFVGDHSQQIVEALLKKNGTDLIDFFRTRQATGP